MDGNHDPGLAREFPGPAPSSGNSYALSGKIMLSAVVILLFVVILMAFFHLYVSWYLTRAARRRRRRHRRMVFFIDPTSVSAATGGLAESEIKSLPVFVFSASNQSEFPAECPVCLSEFEEGESGRVLPGCKHSFHMDCIDAWFRSHSTCPLCRSAVEPVSGPEKPVDVSVTVPDPVPDESGPATNPDETGNRRRRPPPIKLPGSSIDESAGESTRSDSSAAHCYKSPVSRVLSLRRMLSREGRTTPLPSPAARHNRTTSNCEGSLTESDIESGGRE